MAVTNVKEGSSAEACDIPKTCIGAVVKNEGPDFYVEIETLDVPEISKASTPGPGREESC